LFAAMNSATAALRSAIRIGRRLPQPPAVLPWCASCRHAVGTGRRDFYQRLNEQHLAHELKNLSMSAQGGGAQDAGEFKPRMNLKSHRKPSPVQRREPDKMSHSRSSGSKSADFSPSAKTKPWLHYESMRGEAFANTPNATEGGPPRWRDLTHGEAQRMQEMYMRKRMLDRKFLWMKTQHLPNPQKDAKMEIRRREKAEDSEGNDMYPPPFLEKDSDARQFAKIKAETQQEELESRFRSRIRQQKLENARIVKANIPDVGNFVTDPIKRHVQRRLLRQRVKIHAGLEEFLTNNSSQILHEVLGGAPISIVRVRAKRPRQTQEIVYNCTSDHDPEWVQKQLDTVAPKLRSQLAVSVNMGQTPNIKFVPQVPLQHTRRKHLMQFARQIQAETPVGSKTGVAFAGGTLVPHGNPKRQRSLRSLVEAEPT